MIEQWLNNEIAEELFDLLFSAYQIGLETQIRGSDFMFDCFILLYYKCYVINFNCRGSYIDSSNWIKKIKATINPKMIIVNVLNMQQQLHLILVKFKKTHKEFWISFEYWTINNYNRKSKLSIKNWRLEINCKRIIHQQKYVQHIFQKLIQIVKNN